MYHSYSTEINVIPILALYNAMSQSDHSSLPLQYGNRPTTVAISFPGTKPFVSATYIDSYKKLPALDALEISLSSGSDWPILFSKVRVSKLWNPFSLHVDLEHIKGPGLFYVKQQLFVWKDLMQDVSRYEVIGSKGRQQIPLTQPILLHWSWNTSTFKFQTSFQYSMQRGALAFFLQAANKAAITVHVEVMLDYGHLGNSATTISYPNQNGYFAIDINKYVNIKILINTLPSLTNSVELTYSYTMCYYGSKV
jgi:hypothetical protein